MILTGPLCPASGNSFWCPVNHDRALVNPLSFRFIRTQLLRKYELSSELDADGIYFFQKKPEMIDEFIAGI